MGLATKRLLAGIAAALIGFGGIVAVLFLPMLMANGGVRFWMPIDMSDLMFGILGMYIFLGTCVVGFVIVWMYGFARKRVSALGVAYTFFLGFILTVILCFILGDAFAGDLSWVRYFVSMWLFSIIQMGCSWGLAYAIRCVIAKYWGPEDPGNTSRDDATTDRAADL